MATDGQKLNQLPELTTLSDATMLYAVDGGEDYHVNFETIKDETVPEVFTPTTDGLVPHPNSGNGGKVLRGDGTWQGTFDSSNDGLVPKLGTNDKDNVLRGDGTWVTNDKLIGTGSGSLVTFDAIEAPMPSLKVSVEAQQDLHGYDHPWVGGAGKNKLPMTVDGIKAVNTRGTWSGNSYTVNGVTFKIVTDDDGNVLGVHVSGTNTGSAGIIFYLHETSDFVLPAGTYIYSSGVTSVSGNIRMRFNDTSFFAVTTSEVTRTMTESHDVTSSIVIEPNDTTTGILFAPMVRKSTDVSGFAPYSNICSISGWSEVNVSDVGKNLFNPATVTVNKGIDSTGQIVDSSTSLVSDYIPVKPNVNYYLTCYNDAGNRRTNFYDSEKNFISTTEPWYGSRTFITPTNASYCIISIGQENYEDAQLEIGTSATAYEPYNPDSYTTTISLPQTVYGAEVDVVNGVLRITHKIISLTNPSAQNHGKFLFRGDDNTLVENTDTQRPSSDFICDKFGVYSIHEVISNNKVGLSISKTSGGYYVYDLNTKDMTLEQAQAYYGENPITVRYPLATPTTIPLTPTLIKSLNGQNNLSVDSGDVIEGEYQRSITEAINALEAGGGYSETSLWSNSSGVYTGSLALSDSIENYNALMFKVSNAQGWANFAFVPTSALASNNAKAGIGGGMQSAVWWFQFTRTDATHITINNNSSTGDKLYQIVGVKY